MIVIKLCCSEKTYFRLQQAPRSLCRRYQIQGEGHYCISLFPTSLHPLQICDPNAKPEIVRETASTALIEGNNSLGAVVGNFAMGVAIEKAKSTGVGWVTVRGSNHFGIAGHYSAQALSQNMLGMAFTNGRSIKVDQHLIGKLQHLLAVLHTKSASGPSKVHI